MSLSTVSPTLALSSRPSQQPAAARGSLPAGIGLRPQHHEEIIVRRPPIGWFEVHSENYFARGGAHRAQLARIRGHYPLSLHGVGLSLGSTDPLNTNHLRELKRLARE